MSRRISTARWRGKRSVKAHNQKPVPAVLGLPTPGPLVQPAFASIIADALDTFIDLTFTGVPSNEGSFTDHTLLSLSSPDGFSCDVSLTVQTIRFNKIDAVGPLVAPWTLQYDGAGSPAPSVGGVDIPAFQVGACVPPAIIDVPADFSVVDVAWGAPMDMTAIPAPSRFVLRDGSAYWSWSLAEWLDRFTLRLSGKVTHAANMQTDGRISYAFGVADTVPWSEGHVRSQVGLIRCSAWEREFATP